MKQNPDCTNRPNVKNGLDHAKIWSNLNWVEIRRNVEGLQRRIFRASCEGDQSRVENLQRLMKNSYHAQCLAVKQITCTNQGRNTPGSDGLTYKTAEQKSQLLHWLNTLNLKHYNPPAVKRVTIKKPNGGLRCLGIPTIKDRCVQFLIKLALEPEWEAKFHAHSFGFRPGRSTQDAVEKIVDIIKEGNGNFITNADISGFFDHVKHDAILRHISLFGDLIKKWLNAGILTTTGFLKSEKGTPQGGIISPLLANIALYQLEYAFNKSIRHPHYPNEKITLIRYADDFVLLTRSKWAMKRIGPPLQKFLKERGLSLNLSKTYTVRKSTGVDFLGFQIVQYPGKAVWVRPSKQSFKRIQLKVKETLRLGYQTPLPDVISQLNHVIRGWGMYFRYCKNYNIFGTLDHYIFQCIWRWCNRQHNTRGKRWIKNRYFTEDWRFTADGRELVKLQDIKRRRYSWRINHRSPFDGPLQQFIELKAHTT